jgi:homoserine/homoserine lactone efflux protein
MTVATWLLFCLTETALCLSPGPSALLVVSLGLTRGRRAGLFAAVGVLAANALYFTFSASGLVTVHALSRQAFLAIKWAGAAYLIWLGARMIARSFRALVLDPPPGALSSGRRSFWQGLVTQGSNPNLLVYFTAILPQFLSPAEPLPRQVAILAGSSFIIEFTALSLYAVLASRAGRMAAPHSRAVAERIGGGLLVAAGAGLASVRRA